MEDLQHERMIDHASHPHRLHLIAFPPRPEPTTVTCAGCGLLPERWIYACRECSFFLHISCARRPLVIEHPAHPHHLILQIVPAYPSGHFICDACGHKGGRFSYRCADCRFDVHIHCAAMPLRVHHQAHHHPLNLTFLPPHPDRCFGCNGGYRGFGRNPWLYRCTSCNFDIHMLCATANAASLALLPDHRPQPPVERNHYAWLPPQRAPAPMPINNGMAAIGIIPTITYALVESEILQLVKEFALFLLGAMGGGGS